MAVYMYLSICLIFNLAVFRDLTLSQDVSIVTTKNAKYEHEKLKFACNLQSSNLWKSINTVILSKNTSSGTYKDIVTVLMDTSSPNTANWRNQTIWHQQSEWGNRASVLREYVEPVTSSSGLEFDIPAHQVKLSDEGTYRCKITGITTTSKVLDKEKTGTVTLTHAPDITVSSPTYTQNDDIRIVTCYPSGKPDNYTYHKWQHRSKYGELIREFNGNKTLRLPDAPELLIYQDTGEYVCIASNGIKDKYNKFEQTGSGLVTVNAQPVYTSDTINKVKQFGEISKAVDIYVNVYSVPQLNSSIWSRDGTQITTQNSAKYETSSSSTIVKDKIHGKEVQLDGYNVTLTIRDLIAEDFTDYTVTLINGFGTVTHTIVLESAESSKNTSVLIGGVVGAVVTLGIVCAAVIVILFLKRRKGQNQTDKNDTSYENSGLQERQNNDEYEEVGNQCVSDMQQKQSNTTYESLGVKDMLNVYDGLENRKGLTTPKPPIKNVYAHERF
ncbi:titin-like isoform X2 [Mytilus edulis]|uniref:titin-like isoform X2 n=1 Tax=Mytilus edulis TaxID=6550 RepID=UPI0039EF5F16